MAFSTGYDMQLEFKFGDGLGKFYTGFATAWSLILISGIVFLVLNRDLPFISIRNVHLTVSAVALLHVYWFLCLVAYGLNGFFRCDTEFWIMSIYLPLGIALFHLSNTKLLHVAVLQRKFVSTESLLGEKRSLLRRNHGLRDRIQGLRSLSEYKKTKWLIVVGMTIQLVASLIIFLVSRKFHGDFGLVGQASDDTALARRNCRKGWEWVPSIAWQFLWAWIYAPYLLWKVRNIQDTHGWRMQTLIVCIAGLPASPMWLLALYLPQMSRVNAYYIPPLWFAPSILLTEAFMVFQPCWQILRHHHMKKETLEIIAQWEKQSNVSSIDSDSTKVLESPHRIPHKGSVISSRRSRKAHAHMYTMAALDKALQTNPTPLLLFAALKDFTGENISFLNHVREWNRDWLNQSPSAFQSNTNNDEADLCFRQFVKAVEIYSSFVSLRDSNFPINISHSHLKELESIFEASASILNNDRVHSLNSATPFDDFELQPQDVGPGQGKDELSVASTAFEVASDSTEYSSQVASKQSTVVNIYKVKSLGDKLPQSLPIPQEFGHGVFDNAAESVKYMVLTNTWPKFVNAGYAANMERGTAMERFQERLGACGLGRSRNSSF